MNALYKNQALLLASLWEIAGFYLDSSIVFHHLLKEVRKKNPQIIQKDGTLCSGFLERQRKLHAKRIKTATHAPSLHVLEIFLTDQEPWRTIETLSAYDGDLCTRELRLSDLTDHPENLCFIPLSKTERMLSRISLDYDGCRPEDESDGLAVSPLATGGHLACDIIARKNSAARQHAA